MAIWNKLSPTFIEWKNPGYWVDEKLNKKTEKWINKSIKAQNG